MTLEAIREKVTVSRGLRNLVCDGNREIAVVEMRMPHRIDVAENNDFRGSTLFQNSAEQADGPHVNMDTESTRSTKTLGLAGTFLFILGVAAMATPSLRSIPILAPVSLIVGALLCAIGAIRESKCQELWLAAF